MRTDLRPLPIRFPILARGLRWGLAGIADGLTLVDVFTRRDASVHDAEAAQRHGRNVPRLSAGTRAAPSCHSQKRRFGGFFP